MRKFFTITALAMSLVGAAALPASATPPQPPSPTITVPAPVPANPADPWVKRAYDAGWTDWSQQPPASMGGGGDVSTLAAASTGSEDDSGDEVAGLSVTKVECRNYSSVNGPDIWYEGACMLLYSDGTNRAKFRVTSYRYSTNQLVATNHGWDLLDPHYRRVYVSLPDGAQVAEATTQARGACISCTSSVGYSIRRCLYPVGGYAHYAKTASLTVRGSDGLRRVLGVWQSGGWKGCGP